MTTSLLARAGGAALLALSLVATGAGAAQAAVETLHDPVGDSRTQFDSGDIRKVRITHGPRALRLAVTHAPKSGLADVYVFNVDTDARRAGPEWVVSTGTEVEEWRVLRADGWGGAQGDVVCRAANDVDFDRQRMRLVVPRRCLGTPARVRLNLVTHNDYPGTPVDHAPRKRGFGPWVTAG